MQDLTFELHLFLFVRDRLDGRHVLRFLFEALNVGLQLPDGVGGPVEGFFHGFELFCGLFLVGVSELPVLLGLFFRPDGLSELAPGHLICRLFLAVNLVFFGKELLTLGRR